MKPAPRRWELSTAAPLDGFSPVLGRLLASRGWTAAAARDLVGGAEEDHDPFALHGMAEAVIAIGVAVREGRPIAVYGDYDADGVTACAMLTRALRAAGAAVVPYIPNRMTEGYGLHAPALAELHARGVGLVVTVDCGTSSVEVAAGRPEGLALVVTDHHLAPAPGGGPVRLPEVEALVNPKNPACAYPFDALAGAGVAWKLLEALESEAVVPPGSAAAAVALAAVGTIADMMPLRGENRTVVRRGLAQLADDPAPGLRALLEVAGVRGRPRASDVAFMLAPRLNAAGRMEDAELALRLCLVDTVEEAMPLALQLNAQNRERQGLVARALAEAEARVAAIPEDAPAIILGDPGWPMGIVGLVAGRLADRYARPSFVVCLDGEEAKGSARSVRGVHLVEALDAASAPLLRYGGHAAAAGFSLPAARLSEFMTLVSESVGSQLGDAPRERVFRVDAVVGAEEIDLALCGELAALEPCGQGNPEALLALHGAVVRSTRSFGAEGQHIGVVLAPPEGGRLVEAIAFNKPGLARHLPVGRSIDACFGLEVDEWNGERRVRLRLRDLRPCRDAARVGGGSADQGAPLVAAVA